jgi:hypothetical protein
MILGATEEASMKKQAKKMVLSKETLRNLAKGELVRVAGEASTYACTDSVCCSGGLYTCNCPGTTGTSRYC